VSGVFWREGSEVVADLDELERDILDDLARQVVELLEPEQAPSSDPIEVMVGIGGGAEPPDDPALARLLPDAFTDDEEGSAEFRRFTELELRRRKLADAAAVRRVLASAGDVRLDDDDARRWLGFLNDVRLVIGTRLGVSEEPEDLAPDDPRLPFYSVYGWLGLLQETLVESLVPRHP
jgi:hypothetical protein